ncbi:hypothetical protein EXIGLDRAFT_724072 [Exidia glandulosa HHB12029]|uniref:AA1-like domain-containing protein n=1 Tax=Exidia glandulosa HHB12029 TaxID=1314781 RepID=A0A165EK20_EXIGL|nr:hypothetical protein EXIGLDRAFT_724072 [Exidia glandulosa HHB12029]
MRLATIFTALLPVAVVLAQGQVPGTLLTGSANILVSLRDDETLNETSIGCLTVDGQVTDDTTACGTFQPSTKTSNFGGTAIEAGSGACGRLKGPHGAFACNSSVTDKAVLGFYILDGKLAAQELYTVWSIDGAPNNTATQTLFWQGLHPSHAVMTWSPV